MVIQDVYSISLNPEGGNTHTLKVRLENGKPCSIKIKPNAFAQLLQLLNEPEESLVPPRDLHPSLQGAYRSPHERNT